MAERITPDRDCGSEDEICLYNQGEGICERCATGAELSALENESAELRELAHAVFWYFGQDRYSLRPASGGYYLFDTAGRYPVRIDPDPHGPKWMLILDALRAAAAHAGPDPGKEG